VQTRLTAAPKIDKDCRGAHPVLRRGATDFADGRQHRLPGGTLCACAPAVALAPPVLAARGTLARRSLRPLLPLDLAIVSHLHRHNASSSAAAIVLLRAGHGRGHHCGAQPAAVGPRAVQREARRRRRRPQKRLPRPFRLLGRAPRRPTLLLPAAAALAAAALAYRRAARAAGRWGRRKPCRGARSLSGGAAAGREALLSQPRRGCGAGAGAGARRAPSSFASAAALS
jgi:hypothetical protein